MRKWCKYWLDPATSGVQRLPIDQDFSDHAKGMGGYEETSSYVSAEDFLTRYLPRNGGRHDCYDDFLQRHLKKGRRILSIASGRAANEAYLFQQGHCVLCTDIEIPPAYDSLQKLFPGLEYKSLDILKNPAPSQYDTVVCLSLFYLFTDEQLRKVLKHIFQSLREGGDFILDASTSADNFLSFLLHDIFLPFEICVRRYWDLFVKGKRSGLIIKHHGFRRTDQEIINFAEGAGFSLDDRKDYGFLMEFRRSALLSRLLKPGSWITKLFERFGQSIPYVRMFYFKKSQAGPAES